MRNKKANIVDIGMAMTILFVAAIVFLSVKYSYTEFANRAINNTIINSSAASVQVFSDTRDMTNRYDYILFALLMGFTFAILILAYFTGGHPIFMFIYFIGLILIIITSAVLSFVWEKITDTTILSGTATQLPITDLILSNFPIYIAILGFIGMLIMFAKPTFSSM